MLLCCDQEEMRHSSYGDDESEESDAEQSPPLPRRGRRQAIFDSKVIDYLLRFEIM